MGTHITKPEAVEAVTAIQLTGEILDALKKAKADEYLVRKPDGTLHLMAARAFEGRYSPLPPSPSPAAATATVGGTGYVNPIR